MKPSFHFTIDLSVTLDIEEIWPDGDAPEAAGEGRGLPEAGFVARGDPDMGPVAEGVPLAARVVMGEALRGGEGVRVLLPGVGVGARVAAGDTDCVVLPRALLLGEAESRGEPVPVAVAVAVGVRVCVPVM